MEPEPPPAPPTVLSHELNPPHHGPRGYCVYGSAEYLFWWFREASSFPLLTTGPLGSSSVLLGNFSFDDRQYSGVRATAGSWLNQCQTVGLEVTGLYLGTREPSTVNGAPLLARPFIDATTGAPSAAILSSPGTQLGAATVQTLNRLWGAEGNLRCELCRGSFFNPKPPDPPPCVDACGAPSCPKPPPPPRGCCYHLDLLLGFRYLEFDDGLNIFSTTTFAPDLVGAGGSTVSSQDSFATRNTFYGGQIGLDGEVHYGKFFVDAWGKVALGNMHEVVNIAGSTTFSGTGGVGTISQLGGLLALPTNIGSYSRNQFVVLPEVGLNAGFKLTSHLRATVGYSFLYINRVVRGVDQIDPVLNVSQRPSLTGTPGTLIGPPHPVFTFQETSFWAQGVNAGLEFRF
jgi:hypothetical protein